MNDLERRLSDLLHTGTPEPERVIISSEIAGLAQDGRTPNQRHAQRWGVPLLAAAAVLVAVAVPVVIFGHNTDSFTPTSPSVSLPAPAPTNSAPTNSASSTASNTVGSATTCLTSQLSLTPGPQDGTAGSLYATFYLTNAAATPCSMHGFPGVSLLDAGGNIVGQPATRDGTQGLLVRLDRGQRARFILRVGTATRTGCDVPRPSSEIQVHPPEQTVPLRIPFSTASCAITVQSLRS